MKVYTKAISFCLEIVNYFYHIVKHPVCQYRLLVMEGKYVDVGFKGQGYKKKKFV